MRTIAHISDLHFGSEDRAVAPALVADLLALSPSLLVVSGDLTQRARTSQFQAARRWLTQLPFPQLIVPGNHDVPLFDAVRRFLCPYSRYRSFISDQLNPWFEDEELAVLGLNTARALTWKSGRISRQQIELVSKRFSIVPEEKFNVLITHHPFIPPPGHEATGIDLLGRAAEALPAIDSSSIDLLLAGHLHNGYTGDVRSYYPAAKRSVIVVQAGTAISNRHRGEPNGYNLLRLEREWIQITVRCWNGSAFHPEAPLDYRLVRQEWRVERSAL